MEAQRPQLPPEVWLYILGYLSTADKLSIRACAKLFRKLVDHGSLWRDYPVVLDFENGPYNSRFWSTLRRRKIRHVVVESTKARDWKQLALSLPALATVVMEQVSQGCVHYLKDFPHLKRLTLRNKFSPLFVDSLVVSEPRQLTHLGVCNVIFPTPTRDIVSAFVLQFTNLTHLVCHLDGNRCDPVQLFNAIITGLPRLEHLSWGMNRWYPIVHDEYDPYNVNQDSSDYVNGHSDSLTSLELVNFMNTSLSQNTMRYLPSLQRLTVLYKYSYEDMEITQRHDNCCLKVWLSDLHQLSNLVIVNGPRLHEYANYIPATVTSLSLCVGHLSSSEMATTAAKVPNLLHLHLDPWPSRLGVHNSQMPVLFPKLRSLKIRHQHVAEKEFLNLRHFPDLKFVKILDGHPTPVPHLSELINQLKLLSNHRIGVITCPERRNPLACMCAGDEY